MNIYREQKRKMKKYIPVFAVFGVALIVILFFSSTSSLLKYNSDGDCLVSFGDYHGHRYKTIDTVGDGKCLVQSKWMQVMQVSLLILLL